MEIDEKEDGYKSQVAKLQREAEALVAQLKQQGQGMEEVSSCVLAWPGTGSFHYYLRNKRDVQLLGIQVRTPYGFCLPAQTMRKALDDAEAAGQRALKAERMRRQVGGGR